jgi:GT2 family glycosyltransferase
MQRRVCFNGHTGYKMRQRLARKNARLYGSAHRCRRVEYPPYLAPGKNIWAAFFRLTGFAKQLAKTRLYDKARKDWVDEFQVTEIDIVNGACMLLRSSALSQVGPFDERFVQYGHDIDLSYRLRLAGFKNFYFPKTYFFKYQDQQEQSFTLNHIRHLVGAMLQFAIKYIFRFPDIKVQELPQLYPTSYQVKG